MAAGDQVRVSRFVRTFEHADTIAMEWQDIGATDVVVSRLDGSPACRVIGRMSIEAFAKWSAKEARRDVAEPRPWSHSDDEFSKKGGT